MSNESDALLEKYIEQHKVEFPIVRSVKGSQTYKVKGYPTYAVIGADGQLAADLGHGKPSAALLEEHLADVTLLPEPPSSKVKSLAKTWEKKQFGKIPAALAKLRQGQLSAAEAEFVDTIDKTFNERVAKTTERVKALGQGPDYFAAQSKLQRIAKEYAGTPPGGEADAELKRFKGDKAIGKEISAGKAFAKLSKKFDLSKRSDRKKAATAYSKFAKKYDGTHAGQQAADMLGRIQGGP